MRPPDVPEGAPRPADSHWLVLGSSGGGWTSVEALHPEDGLAQWTYEPYRELNDVACDNGTVFVSTRIWHRIDRREPVRVVALRAEDGAELWRVEEAQVRWRLLVLRLLYGLRVALAQFSLRAARFAVRSLHLAGTQTLRAGAGMVFASADAAMFTFDAGTGALRRARPELSGGQSRVLAAHAGRVYVQGRPGGIQALDARSGKPVWSNKEAGAERVVAADDERIQVYSATKWGEGITALRAADGTLEWRYVPRDGQEMVLGASDDGVVYVLRERRICAIRTDDGSELWRGERVAEERGGEGTPTPGEVMGAIEGHRVYYAGIRRQAESWTLRVGALDADSGTALWRWDGPELPLPTRGGASVTAALGNVYVNSGDGVFAFRGEDGRLLWHTAAGFSHITGPHVVARKRKGQTAR